MRFAIAAMMLAVSAGHLKAASIVSTFDMQSVPAGLYQSSLVLTNNGLTLTITPEGAPSGSLYVDNSSVPLVGIGVVGNQTASIGANQFAPVRFTFSAPVTQIVFTAGDTGGEDDSPVAVSAFSASNVLLGTLSDSYPEFYGGGRTLSGSFANASYFIASSGQIGNNANSVFWDAPRVVWSDSPPTVPEPTSMALAGFAGIGMAVGAWRRRRQQKQAA